MRAIALAVLAVIMLVDVAQAACGLASWYGPGFHGRKTASGVVFNQDAMTAAHKTLPFGTKLRVSYQGRSATVTINDRGPFVGKRVLDLSRAAATKLGLRPAGVGRVCWERL